MKSNHGALSNIDGLQKKNHCRKSLRINGKYSKRRKKCIENTFKQKFYVKTKSVKVKKSLTKANKFKAKKAQ